jgi:hypothetical protein
MPHQVTRCAYISAHNHKPLTASGSGSCPDVHPRPRASDTAPRPRHTMSTAATAQRHNAQRTVLALTKKRPSDVNDVSWNKSPVGAAHTRASMHVGYTQRQRPPKHTLQRPRKHEPATTSDHTQSRTIDVRLSTTNLRERGLPAALHQLLARVEVHGAGALQHHVRAGNVRAVGVSLLCTARHTATPTHKHRETNLHRHQTRRCKDTPKRTKHSQKTELGDSIVPSDERRVTSDAQPSQRTTSASQRYTRT